MFLEGLNQFLLAQPTITSIVGTSRSDNTSGIYPVLAIGSPILPYLVYMKVTGQPAFSYQGANRLTFARLRFSCYGSKQPDAEKLAKALRDLFATWTGSFPNGVVVQNVMQEMEADDVESIPRGTIFAVHVDFSFTFVEPNS